MELVDFALMVLEMTIIVFVIYAFIEVLKPKN